ncbi:MAG: efflux RND transporter periplasmic adaptor subunit [Bacteroidota bacterium]|nr:efflux RND transporter periplasmic adaptor subunit [Bacteroidota bacterium]MDP4211874.1 efflux RND transporter periplasmic adaptor subunit [Bacteroidota bacterium]MDP4248537.1 efflux RND transporter periplasmic adaptor subunit [Bacteroidota bacterium]
MTKQISLVLGVLFILSLFSACKNKQDLSKKKPEADIYVDALIASSQPITNTIEVNGTVVANEYVELHPEASGRITYLNVPEGKRIAAGTVIACINNADLEAQLNKSKVQLDLAEKTEERNKQLLAVNGINQSDYDISLNAVNGFKADIAYNQALLDKTILKAPFSGIIGLRQVSLGAYVSPTTLIATLLQLDRIKIDFTLPEGYGSVLKVGGTVDVELDAASNTKKKARIIAIEPQVNQSSRSLTVRAILENSNPNPGAFVKVYVNAGVDKNAILVPTNALIPNDKDNQMILVKNGRASFVNVTAGLRLANNVVITRGLKEGDTVVVTGVLFARPKAKLDVRSIKTLDQFAALNNNGSNSK